MKVMENAPAGSRASGIRGLQRCAFCAAVPGDDDPERLRAASPLRGGLRDAQQRCGLPGFAGAFSVRPCFLSFEGQGRHFMSLADSVGSALRPVTVGCMEAWDEAGLAVLPLRWVF